MENTTNSTKIHENTKQFRGNQRKFTKIKQIQFVGNSAYSNRDLLDEFKLTTRGFWTWLTKNDQYSKPKLEADWKL